MWKKLVKRIYASCPLSILIILLAGTVRAEYGLNEVILNVYGSFAAIANMIAGFAYIGGLAFAVASVFKFKQNRDNPQQVPIGQPIVLLTVAVGLTFMPSLLVESKSTLFSSTSGQYIGVGANLTNSNPWAAD